MGREVVVHNASATIASEMASKASKIALRSLAADHGDHPELADFHLTQCKRSLKSDCKACLLPGQ